MVGASLNPLRPQISSLRSQRLSGTVSKKWLGWETALETVMYDYLYVFCMYWICTCRSCSSSGGCWLFLSGDTPNQSLFSTTASLLVFSMPLTPARRGPSAHGTAACWIVRSFWICCWSGWKAITMQWAWNLEGLLVWKNWTLIWKLDNTRYNCNQIKGKKP